MDRAQVLRARVLCVLPVFHNNTVCSEGDQSRGLRGDPFDPLCAPGARLERIRKILSFPCNLVAAELHNAYGVGRLTVIRQNVFSDPKITAANDSAHRETLFTRLLGARDLDVASTTDSLA